MVFIKGENLPIKCILENVRQLILFLPSSSWWRQPIWIPGKTMLSAFTPTVCWWQERLPIFVPLQQASNSCFLASPATSSCCPSGLGLHSSEITLCVQVWEKIIFSKIIFAFLSVLIFFYMHKVCSWELFSHLFSNLHHPYWYKILLQNAGLIPSDKESATYPLYKKGGGNAVVIAVGGAPEALDAHPGTFNVLLAKKKGFIKMAMVHGWVWWYLWVSERGGRDGWSSVRFSEKYIGFLRMKKIFMVHSPLREARTEAYWTSCWLLWLGKSSQVVMRSLSVCLPVCFAVVRIWYQSSLLGKTRCLIKCQTVVELGYDGHRRSSKASWASPCLFFMHVVFSSTPLVSFPTENPSIQLVSYHSNVM